MHTWTFDQQSQIAFAAQQRLHPIAPTYGGFFGHTTIVNPRVGALQEFEQTLHAVITQRAHAWLLRPMAYALTQTRVQVRQQRRQIHVIVFRCAAFAFAVAVGFGFFAQAQQAVKLLRHQFAVAVELCQEVAHITKAQGQRNPIQVFVVGGQCMGLLVVQVLNAVFDLAQKHIGFGQRIGGGGGHEVSLAQALQGLQRGACAQLREMAAAHHLQQLHGEFNFSNAAACKLHIVGALRPSCAA